MQKKLKKVNIKHGEEKRKEVYKLIKSGKSPTEIKNISGLAFTTIIAWKESYMDANSDAYNLFIKTINKVAGKACNDKILGYSIK